MYNPYFYQQQNYLPQQQVIQVNGKASVDTIQLAPNSSVLVMDTSAPIVWLCVSDGVGKVTATPYDITLHQDAPPIDMGSFEERLSKIENYLKGVMNEQSDVSSAKPDKTGSGKKYD